MNIKVFNNIYKYTKKPPSFSVFKDCLLINCFFYCFRYFKSIKEITFLFKSKYRLNLKVFF